MSELLTSDGVILFAQVGAFSHTNDSLSEAMTPHLNGMKLETFRVYPIIKSNPLYLAYCLAAVPFHYGPSAMLDRGSLAEKMVKSPAFFGLASKLVRERAASIGNLRAVLQTQGLFNAKVAGRPLVIYTDNTMLNLMDGKKGEGSPILPLERVAYRDAAQICVSANHVVDSLVEFYDIHRNKVSAVGIGANTPSAPASPPGRFGNREVLFIGVDWERKGGPELVDAFRRLRGRFPDARLKIVGCSPEVDAENVTVLGRVSLEEVARHIAQASIFCMPSKDEPFGIAAIEAARSGLPVVGTAVGGMLESVLPGKSGFLVQPGNVDQLQDALERLLGDPALCEQMGREGAAWAEQFSWDAVSCRIMGHISQAIEDGLEKTG